MRAAAVRRGRVARSDVTPRLLPVVPGYDTSVQRFTSRDRSRAIVPAPRQDIWPLLRSPEDLADMTPLVASIAVDGDRWCWQLSGISALGVEVAPAFSERMTFDEPSCIRFEHDPPAGATERAGADGTYRLVDRGDGRTELAIDITIHVLLPLPRLSRGAVERVMASTMQRTGEAFAERLYRRLGVDPDDAEVLPAA